MISTDSYKNSSNIAVFEAYGRLCCQSSVKILVTKQTYILSLNFNSCLLRDVLVPLHFWKFWAQIPKFGNFGPKSIILFNLSKTLPEFRIFEPKTINFVILTKICLGPILKVLISYPIFVFKHFEPKSSNLGILTQKAWTF